MIEINNKQLDELQAAQLEEYSIQLAQHFRETWPGQLHATSDEMLLATVRRSVSLAVEYRITATDAVIRLTALGIILGTDYLACPEVRLYYSHRHIDPSQKTRLLYDLFTTHIRSQGL